MRNSRAGTKAAPLPKIFASGLKRMVVPRRFFTGPKLLQRAIGMPARKTLPIELLPARYLHLEVSRTAH